MAGPVELASPACNHTCLGRAWILFPKGQGKGYKLARILSNERVKAIVVERG